MSSSTIFAFAGSVNRESIQFGWARFQQRQFLSRKRSGINFNQLEIIIKKNITWCVCVGCFSLFRQGLPGIGRFPAGAALAWKWDSRPGHYPGRAEHGARGTRMQGGDHRKRGYLHHDHRERAAEHRDWAGCHPAEHLLPQIHEHRWANGKVSEPCVLCLCDGLSTTKAHKMLYLMSTNS